MEHNNTHGELEELTASFSHAHELLMKWTNSGQPVTLLDGVRGPLRDLLLVKLMEDIGRPLVVVVPTETEAEWVTESFGGLLRDERQVCHFPMTDVSPYQSLPANRLLEADRLRALQALLSSHPPKVTVVSARSLDLLTLPRAEMERASFRIEVGEEATRERLQERLQMAGYTRVPMVADAGDYAVRGSIVDIFTTGASGAVRVDFFGDEIDSIRGLSSETQRSGEDLSAAQIPPAREVLLTEEGVSRAKRVLQEVAADDRYPSSKLRPLLNDLDAGMLPQHLELFVGLFAEGAETFAAYVPDNAMWVLFDPESIVVERVAGVEDLSLERHESQSGGRLCPPVVHRALVGMQEEWPQGQRIDCPKLLLGPPKYPKVTLQARSNTALSERMRRLRAESGGIGAFVEQALEWIEQGSRVMVVCRGLSGVERLSQLLTHHRVSHADQGQAFRAHVISDESYKNDVIHIFTGSIDDGFQLDDPAVVVLSESEIFGKRSRRKRKRRKESAGGELFGSFADLNVGGTVVHMDHGVARYEGLVRLTIDGVIGDFLELMFRDDNRLYLPVYRLNRVQKYVGSEEGNPALDKLGGTSWERTRARVKQDLWELAERLVATEAKRQSRMARPCLPIDEDFRAFEAGFAYEPTTDQQQAIDDVMDDLEKPKPMDRLVCGDVGFGKTEVAIRAAFRVIQSGGQVAILVPTTILAEQHLRTFSSRMEEFAVETGGLSRFRSTKESKKTIEGLASGRIDLVVGTHRLLGGDVQFRRLRLIIVDEEHRFGVRHKESLKELKETVHVLTLTATPIPRTLHFALAGLRELSTIATPPRDRLAVQTIVQVENDEIVEEAIRRELKRGGQVFYIHNRVSTIETCAERLQKLVPEARIVVGHGQMPERRLEKVMRSFVEGESNVLVSTTIVENGLDIPNANTLLVERSDRFGLADLYQLRGRVGRGPKRAYAYFLISSGDKITKDASARLQALRGITGLGGGFQIAQRDLEIRGAGNILGKQQSGQINAIGYELYSEMLEEALSEIHGQPQEVKVDTELHVSVPAFLGEDYCPETRERLKLYKQLSNAETNEEVDAYFEGMVDRAGRPPQEAKNLFELARIRIAGQRMRLNRIEFSSGAASFQFDSSAEIDVEKVLVFLGCTPGGWRMSGDGQSLVRPLTSGEFGRGLETLKKLLICLVDGLGLEGSRT